MNKSLDKNSEEMVEIDHNRAGNSSGLENDLDPKNSEFQPSRFKKITKNLSLFHKDQESSKKSCGAKLCEFF